jgi:hypothetical protein
MCDPDTVPISYLILFISMANKKISELESRASLSLSDLMAVGDPSTGYLYKTTISDLKTLTGAGVVSFNGRFGTVNPAEGDYTLTQLGDVIITSAANGDVLKYNGSNWVNTQLYTGTVAQYIDGTGAYQTFPTLLSSDRLVTNVRNTSGATITKGTVVYLNGSSGTLPTIAKAQANAESTSTGTYGVVQDNIANNANGYVVVIGNLTALDTSAYNAGDILWLSPTVAGGYTTTKPVAPNHAVYVGIVTRSSNTQGTIEVKIQNGYELDELHNVLITSVANNDVLVYETASSLWKNKAFSTLSTDTLDSVTGRGNTTANSITVGSVSAAGLSNLLGHIRTFVTTGNTYIGANPGSATDAGFKLDVLGTTRLNGATSVTGVLTGSDTIRSTNGTVTVSISYGSTAGIIGTTSNHSLEIRTNNTYRVGVSTAGVVNVSTLAGTGSRIVVADAAGNLSASSELTGYVTLDTFQTITASKTFSVGFSLASAGGSNQLTSFANTNSIHSGSGGSNIFGFNNSNNIYFGKGLSNGGVIAWNNSVVRTYTLPDATGTIALTSDIPSVSGVYLPLSGGTLTGALNGTTATFSSTLRTDGVINWNGTVGALSYGSGFVTMETNSATQIRLVTNGTTALTIATNQAATFSSSVSANNFVASAGNNTTVFNSSGATTGWVQVGMNNTTGSALLGIESSVAGTLSTGSTAYATIIRNYTNTDLQLATNNIVRATITSGGDIGIGGTPAAGSRLSVFNTIDFDIKLRKLANGGTVGILFETANDFSGTSQAYIKAIGSGNSGLSNLIFGTSSAVGNTSASEMMRLTSGGALLLGTTTATYGQGGRGTFEMNGSTDNITVQKVGDSLANYIYSNASYSELYATTSWRIATNGSERMRITSDGIMLVNATSTVGWAGVKMQVTTDILSRGSVAGYFFENRTGGVTSSSNWYGWYATGGIIRMYNGSTDIFSMNGSTGAATFISDVKVKTLEVTNVGTDATSSGVSTYMRITVNGQNYLIPLHGTP